MKCQRHRLRSRLEQQIRKAVTHRKGRPWEETEEDTDRFGCQMTYIRKMEMSQKEETTGLSTYL
jgi:hypothetical protein